jgi:hypothetical protein
VTSVADQVLGESGWPVPAPTAARAVAVAVLGHRAGGLGITEPLGDGDLRELVEVCEHHRLLGALVEALEVGELPLTDDQLAHVRDRQLSWSIHALDLERLLMEVGACFEGAGIGLRVLKGVALAHTVYGDPSWRTFADLDVLVHPSQLDRAVEVAQAELGGQRAVAEIRPGFDREFGKEAMLEVGGLELDLHRTVVSGPFGLTIDLDDLAAGAGELHLGGRRFATLGPRGRYLHACYNLALGDYPVRLAAVRDLLLVDGLGGVCVGEVVATARDWHATAVVQRAGQLVRELLGGPAPPTLEALAGLTVPARERVALRSYLSPTRSYRRQVASLLAIRGVRPRLRYARGLLAPSAEYLASRGWTTRTHLRRATRRLRGRTGG